MRKKVVLIGGGHGLSNLVKSFKDEDIELSVIVSSTDDGGHTGKIRNEFDCVAVGDLRMVLNALIDEGCVLKDVFNYRFNSIHGVEGVSLGNLIITSLLDKNNQDIDNVISLMKAKENISANVFVSSSNPLVLCAECDNGEVIRGEHIIGTSNKKIKKLFVDKKPMCNKQMIENIKCSDIIVLAPGSLYTSVGAVLCIDEIKGAIKDSLAEIVYICNIMCQDGETKEYTVKDHVDALESILDKSLDRVIVNSDVTNEIVLNRYKEENSSVVSFNQVENRYEVYDLVEIIDGKIRHNGEFTKKIILKQ